MLAAWPGAPALWRCCSASAFSGCVQVRNGGQAPLPRLVAQDAEFCHLCQDKGKKRNSSLEMEEPAGGWGVTPGSAGSIWKTDLGGRLGHRRRREARERWKPGHCREETSTKRKEGRRAF